MGTSKGYIAPTSIEWRQAKRAVSQYSRDTGSSSKMQKAITHYANATASNTEKYIRTGSAISQIAGVFSAASRGTLSEYLHSIDRDDLSNKPLSEIVWSLLQKDSAGNDSETQLLLNTIPKVMDNLEIVDASDLNLVQPISFLIDFLGEFICNDFDHSFEETMRRRLSPVEYDAAIDEVHGYIKTTVFSRKAELQSRVKSFDALSDNGFVTEIISDTYSFMASIYPMEATQ